MRNKIEKIKKIRHNYLCIVLLSLYTKNDIIMLYINIERRSVNLDLHISKNMDLNVLGIPSNKIKQLNSRCIHCVEDLLKYIPTKYYDFRQPIKIGSITPLTETTAIVGKVLDKKIYYKKDRPNVPSVLTVTVADGTGYIQISWFYMIDVFSKILQEGREYIFCGKPCIDENGRKKMNILFFNVNISKYKRIIPVYKEVKGMADEYLQNTIDEALENMAGSRDFLSEDIKMQFGLIDEYSAFYKIHKPKDMNDIEEAKKRFTFDDLFIWNFILKAEQNLNAESDFWVNQCKTWHALLPMLPFELTEDQKNTLKHIYSIMKKKERINSLIQGDVGSGKTVVAEFILALAAENGFQSCLIAPTEVLAEQHYKEINSHFEKIGIKVGYLVGNLSAKDRKKVLDGLKDGTIQVVIGTHAIMGQEVVFRNLGLSIADEEHRFGVAQRNFNLKSDNFYIENMPYVAELNKELKKRKLEKANIFFRNIDTSNIDVEEEFKIFKIKVEKNDSVSKEEQLKKAHAELRVKLRGLMEQRKQCVVIDDRILGFKKELLKLIKNNDKKTKFFKTLTDNEVYQLYYAYKEEIIAKLNEKVFTPHKISMSATPIPRTLAMSIYGDDTKVFTIKSKPNGRKTVKTSVMTDSVKINQMILAEIQKGHQAYIVCPLIDDSESEKMAEVESVSSIYNQYRKEFGSKGVKVAMITGDMPQEEVKEIISKYCNKEIHILVATTIIEVGVNNPNSTIMLICSSDRFGLSSLHQIRGRVGRSSLQSYCILKPNNKEDKKAEIMCRTTDGFEIAQFDLQMRGSGSFLGTKQSGNNKYVMLMLGYPEMYQAITQLTNTIYSDPNLYNQYKFLLNASLN